jgi:hypothetical protein
LSLVLNNRTYDLTGMIYETLGYTGWCRFISLHISWWTPCGLLRIYPRLVGPYPVNRDNSDLINVMTKLQAA